MNKRTRILLLLGLCVIAAIYVIRMHTDDRYSLHALHNSQVDWQGTYFGILPVLSGKAEAVVQANEPEYIPRLICFLDNNDQYAAVHVLLTGISHISSNANDGVWNGLDVQLSHTRQIISTTCPPTIKKCWQ